MTKNSKQGAIYLANLNPKRKNTEMGKVRPVLVIQTQALLNAHHPSTVVLPLTTNLIDNNILRYRLLPQDDLKEESDVVIDQIYTLDNSRFVNNDPLCILSKQKLLKIYQRLSQILRVNHFENNKQTDKPYIEDQSVP